MRLALDQLDEMIDQTGLVDPVVGDAVDIHEVGVVAAAGEADVGLPGLAGSVDDTTDDRERQGRGDVLQPVLQHLHRPDDGERLARA